MSKWNLREEVLRALPLIFARFHENSTSPKNLSELVRMLYSQYETRSNVAGTEEYRKLNSSLRRKKVRRWLAAISGRFRDWELAQCSPEERKLAEAILTRYPNNFNTLCQELSDLLRGPGLRAHSGERYH